MSDAFIESNTNTYRNIITFQSGFGVIADQSFNIGSPTTTSSNLVTYNKHLPLGGISGYVPFTGNGQNIYVPNILSGSNYKFDLNGWSIASNSFGTLIDFNSKQLLNPGIGVSITWTTYQLHDINESTTVDYSNRVLLGGNWVSTIGFILSGTAPTSMTFAGIKGQIAASGTNLYICTGTNQWGKVPLVAF